MATTNETTAPDGDQSPAPSCGAELIDAALDSEEAGDEYVLHPKAIMMPELTEARYAALKAGIRDHGLMYPIKVQKGTGRLLDGRGRLRACRELGIDVSVEEIDVADDDVARYTAADAAKREGLSATEKAVIAMGVLPDCELRAAKRQQDGAPVHQGEKGKAAEIAASLVGVSARYVQLAIELKKKRPELFEQVRSGDLDLADARREMEGKASKPKSKSKQNDGDRCPVPKYMWARLATVIGAVTKAIGGDAPADGLEALLDWAEGELASGEWERRVEAQTEEAAA